ncbi:papain-like cysteine protease family protein [Actinomadura sp. 6N118]|uniref:papain-like cysteine protease family protein n=1 Tax=Actinomadura sp. 6N118 TaxID=3375151 RepID=UPI0037A164BB
MAPLPAKLTGKLTAANPAVFTGWRITAEFEELVSLTPEDGEPRWLPVHRAVSAALNGTYEMALPAEWRVPFIVRALTPTGVVAATRSLTVADVEQPVELTVTPSMPAPIEPSDDPARGRRERLTGRVMDEAGTQASADLLVVLWGVPPGGDDESAYPLLVARTSGEGYFSELWPPDKLDRAYGVVQGGAPIPVPLNSGRLPLRVLLVVPEMPVPATAGQDGADDDCACPATPRVPDPADLANDPSTYASDLGGCTNFTVPNRTVEEVTFHGLVRTSEPEVRGTTFAEPVQLSKPIANYVAALVVERERRGGTQIALTTGESADGNGEGSNADGDAAESTEGGADGGNGRGRPRTVTDMLAARVADADEPELRLDPRVLTGIARDPDRLTSLDLFRAENLTLRKQVGEAVQTLARPQAGRVALDADHEVDWDHTPTTYQATTIAHGHVLTMKQVWRSDGYSLGDLVYSVPLAPGQRKRIAILDWRREELAARSAQRRETEQLGAQLAHDRDISEVVNSSLRENVRGHSESSVGAIGGGIGGFIGPVLFGVGGGYSTSSSSAWQRSARNVAASSLSQMRDRTQQSASAVRSQRVTTVQSARQGEAVRAQTEVVANHSHCHAMTVEYFEVLRHFQVTNELADVRECLFIPFEMTPFTPEKALRHRTVVERYLRRADLAGGPAALERVLNQWRGADFPLQRYADEKLTDLEGELWLSFTLARPRDTAEGLFDPGDWGGYVPFLPEIQSQGQPVPPDKLAEQVWRTYLGVARPADRDRIWNTRIAPRVAQRMVDTLKLDLLTAGGAKSVPLDPTIVTPFVQGHSLLVSLRLTAAPPDVTRAAVQHVKFTFSSTLPGLARVVAVSAAMRYRTDHVNRPLFIDWRLDNDLSSTDAVQIPTPLDTFEKRNPRKEDERVAETLLTHLNDYVEYYHQAIWWTMDANRRHLLLDGYIAPNTGRSVAGAVENRLLAIVGNCLVMPVVPGLRLDPGYEEGTDLRDAYAVPPATPMRVSMPTPGLFAEAMPGSCNSCELIDDTRFWRWEEAPIPLAPPEILPLSTGTRRQPVTGLAADEFPAPVVRMQTAPRAPDPTGLAAALSLIGTPNLFRDITGLDLTQQNVAEAFSSTLSTAKAFGGQAAALAQQRFQSAESDRNLTRIKQAKDKGLISDNEAKELAEAALSGASGQPKPPEGQRPTSNETVQRVMERAANSPSGRVKVTRPSGHVEVRSGDRAPGTEGMDFAVAPPVQPLGQPSPLTCWAAVGAMMLGWRDRTSITIQTAADRAGPAFRAKLDAGQGLAAEEVPAYATALGLRQEGPQSYLPRGIRRLLESYGPLWVIGDDAYENNRLVHATIVTGINGDGSAEGTRVTIIDPADASTKEIGFIQLARLIESTDAVRTGLGVFHW